MDLTKHLGLALAFTAAVACGAPGEEAGADGNGEDVGTQEGAWDAESADNERESTHLWIVERSLDVLAKHSDLPAAKLASRILKTPSCRQNWQQGLLDADFKAAYNNGSTDLTPHPSDAAVALAGTTWESHFYDADTGKNYKGATRPTALSETESHLARSLEDGPERLTSGNATACYELGLALHFFTDLTQPMHAANFTAVDRPMKLHSNLEGYAVEIQDRYRLADWAGAPSGATHDYIIKTAKDSKALFLPGVKAVVNAYNRSMWKHVLKCRNIEVSALRFIERQHIDYKTCWEGDAEVDAAVGTSLHLAQDRTAGFLYLVAQRALAEAASKP